MLPYRERHLDRLGDVLLAYYEKKITAAQMSGKALAGEMPFRWRTDLDYSWMGGWRKSEDAEAEGNLLVVIPGRNRREAVIMADHYDTAYMEDKFKKDAQAAASAPRRCAGGRPCRGSACRSPVEMPRPWPPGRSAPGPDPSSTETPAPPAGWRSS